MLAVFITLLVLIGAAALLLNVLLTGGYFGSVPKGDQAMGLVIPFFSTAAGSLLMLLASLLAAFRGGDTLARLLTGSPLLGGAITVAITLGVVLAAFMAFLCWCEPPMFGIRSGPLVLILGWIAGIIGPILLSLGLLCSAWMVGETARTSPGLTRALAVMFGALALIALVGYGLGAIALYRTMAQQAANRAAAVQQALNKQATLAETLAKPPVQRLKEELDAMSPSAPLWTIVAYFPEANQSFPLDAQCRELLVQRALRVPNLEHAMLETAGSQYYSYRQGVADFITAAPAPLVREHQEDWGQALLLMIQSAADAIRNRPAWLSETLDMNPDPLAHIQSLLNASERFRGLPPHPAIAQALQSLANASTRLNDNEKKTKLFAMLEKAGHKPVAAP
jgi:hypothetical protein